MANGSGFELIWSRLLLWLSVFFLLGISAHDRACHNEREKDGDHGDNYKIVVNVMSLWRIGFRGGGGRS